MILDFFLRHHYATLTDWVCEFILGIGLCWMASLILDRLKLWYRESKAEIQVRELEETDPLLHNAKRWRREP